MQARRVAADRLLVPMRAEGPNGEIGDGMVEIGPDHPQFERWTTWLNRQVVADLDEKHTPNLKQLTATGTDGRPVYQMTTRERRARPRDDDDDDDDDDSDAGKAVTRWDPREHPRDRRGRFIKTGARVRITGGGTGTVVAQSGPAAVTVERDSDGKRRNYPAGHLTVIGAAPANRRYAMRTDDARRAQGQNPSNFPHPVTGHLMGKSEIGDTFEALLLVKGSRMLVAKYGGEYREVARAGGTGTRTTPLDFTVDGRGGEVKTLNAAVPNQKTAMGAASVRRKEQAVSDAGLQPLLVVQVVNQDTMTVKVYAYEAFASKAVTRMEPIGSYVYTVDDFESAQQRTGHHMQRERRSVAQVTKGGEVDSDGNPIEPGDTVIELRDGVPFIYTAEDAEPEAQTATLAGPACHDACAHTRLKKVGIGDGATEG
jgi:hypothetical protein